MSTAPNSKNKSDVLVVIHDAGEAEIIGAYMQRYPGRYAWRALAAGPAARVFRRRGIFFSAARNTSRAIRSALNKRPDFVLLGTGSQFVWNFIEESRRLSIPTVGYLEHWVSYKERFGFPRRGWEKHLPIRLWVGDRPALTLARKLLPVKSITLVPNEYWREVAREYKKKTAAKGTQKAVLVVTQPVTSDSPAILPDILRAVAAYAPDRPVIVRLHPREKQGAYARVIKPYAKRLRVTVSRNKNILDDFAKAECVIGTDSMALVVALQCGKKAVSFMPREGLVCPLPFAKIRKISRSQDLKKVL